MEMKKYYVVFSEEGDIKQWYHRYLKRPFLHCFILYEVEIQKRKYCVKIDSSKNNAFVEILDMFGDNIISLIRNYQQISVERGLMKPPVLEWVIKLDNKDIINIRNVMPTCATLVKVFLGIKSFVFTPYMLYKYMKKNGSLELL